MPRRRMLETPEDVRAFLGELIETTDAALAAMKTRPGEFRSQGGMETAVRDLRRQAEIELTKRTPAAPLSARG